MSSLVSRIQSDETCVPIVPGAWYRECDTPCRRDHGAGAKRGLIGRRQVRNTAAPMAPWARPAQVGVGLQTTAERAGPASLADGVIVLDNAADKSAIINAPWGRCYSPTATTSGGNLGNIFGRRLVSVIERCLIIRSVPSWINSAPENNSKRCSNSADGCRGQHL